VRLTRLFSHSDKDGSYLNALLYFSASDLIFTQHADGMRTALVDIAAVTFDADGRQIDGIDRTFPRSKRIPVRSCHGLPSRNV
jgi:hypothetical protein